MATIERLTRDIKSAMSSLTPREARFLVDLYYQIQDNRLGAKNQERALEKSGEPHSVITWIADNSKLMENDIKKALEKYVESREDGRWLLSIYGIGPIIAAGLLAHIDITKAPTAGHIWSYCGLNPKVKWEKGQKRPWNAAMKKLCWVTGQVFMKFSGRDECFYGKMYLARKAYEVEKNKNKEFAEQASEILRTKKIGTSTEAYKAYSQGYLPPAHIEMRAERYAVKMFLSHVHHVMYEVYYGHPPVRPYIL